MAEIGWWAMLVAVVLTLLSGWSYLRDTPRILSITSKRDQRL
jgi:CDP-diacylglycerol--glycerol-3-phosphate 3-phosphatidyltransferase